MASMNLMPGIHNVKIYSPKENPESPIIRLGTLGDNVFNIEFTLTGLSRLINPITNKLSPFYLYVLVSYQFGGRDFEIISSADIYCDENILEEDNVRYSITVDIPSDKVFSDEDFLWSYYSIDIVFSNTSAEDGSDLNRLLISDKLFSTKLNVTYKDDCSGE